MFKFLSPFAILIKLLGILHFIIYSQFESIFKSSEQFLIKTFKFRIQKFRLYLFVLLFLLFFVSFSKFDKF